MYGLRNPFNCFCRDEMMGGLGTGNLGDGVIEKENYKSQNVFLGAHGHSPEKNWIYYGRLMLIVFSTTAVCEILTEKSRAS